MDGTPRPIAEGHRLALENTLIHAGHDRRLVVVYDGEGRNRIVEPYRIFNGRRNRRRLLQCFQVAGFSEHDEHYGWKNLDLGKVSRITPLDVTFEPRSEFADESHVVEATAPPLRLVRE